MNFVHMSFKDYNIIANLFDDGGVLVRARLRCKMCGFDPRSRTYICKYLFLVLVLVPW